MPPPTRPTRTPPRLLRRPPGRSTATSPAAPTSSPSRTSSSSATGSARLLDPDSFVEDALLANASAADLPADGVVTGVGRVDGRPVVVVANDPTVKAGSWGARTVEKMVRATEYALRHELPDLLAGRLRRGADHRPGRALPGPSRRRTDLLQPGEAVGPRAPDLLPLRPVGGRRCLHPELLRHRDHGRGQRLDVPGVAPHGRDGHRRDHHPRGHGRRPDARHGVGVRRQPRRRRRRRHRPGQGLVQLLPADVARGAAPLPRRRPRACVHRRPRARHREARATTCTRSSTRSSTPTASSS